MLTLEDVRQIIKQLPFEGAAASEDDLSGEAACVVYRTDVFDCGETKMVKRHIDIEFAFGDYHELHEGEALFQHISELCDLPAAVAEGEMVLYQR